MSKHPQVIPGDIETKQGDASSRRRMLLRAIYVLVLTILIADAGLTIINLQTIIDSDRAVDHSREVLVELEHTHSLLKDAETGQRGYLLTNQVRYLEPYYDATARLGRHLDALALLTADNPEQIERVANLRRLANARLQILQDGLKELEAIGLEAARKFIRTNDGQRLMAEARHVVAILRAEEDRLLAKRSLASLDAVRWAAVSFSTVTGLAVVLLLSLAWLKAREDAYRSGFEIALRTTERRFRQLADAMPQIVWTATPDGDIDYWNDRWFEATGMDRERSFDSDGWMEVIFPEDRESVRATWKDALRTECDVEAEYRMAVRGDYRWHLGRAVPVHDDHARIVRWFGTATDVDDLKRAEEALREADRRKDEFLATLAHELRNPLAPILTTLHAMRRDGDALDMVERDHEFARLERQVGRLARLVDDLMDVARITRGRIELRLRTLDLSEIVDQAVETSRPLIDTRRHVLHIDRPTEPLLLEGDPVRLEQVLVNLLNNAARYTEPEGTIWLSVVRDGDDAVLKVRDTGIGIIAEMLPRIFDHFVQGERRLEQSQGGLGIGLGLVKSLIELHGGQIDARSPGPGQGSEFEVRLPARVEPTEDQSSVSVEPPVLTATPPNSVPDTVPPRLRVLVVDDNEEAADSLANLLRRLYRQEVQVTYDGPSALEAADAFHPELILLDLGMTGMDGYEVARRLRSRSEFARTPIIAVTGWGSDNDRTRTRHAGFDHHLVKPVEPEMFETLLNLTAEPR